MSATFVGMPAFPTAAHAAALPVAGLSATFLPAAG